MAEKEKKEITFSPEQLDVVRQMIAEGVKAGTQRGQDPTSMYNLRDPLSIETVNVRQSKQDGKFVIGYKDMQQNPFDKAQGIKVFTTYEKVAGKDEPFLTLLVSSDGVDVEERKIRLDDFMNNYPRFKNVPCLKVEVKEIIDDHGILGASGEYAVGQDDQGKPLARAQIMAQTKRQERTFLIQLPGFKEPYLITDSRFLA